jgi:hypothetical protein
MQEELNNFTRNEVWHLVPRPNQNVVGTKWVFRNNQDEQGCNALNLGVDFFLLFLLTKFRRYSLFSSASLLPNFKAV